MNINELVLLLGGIAGTLNIIWVVYSSLKKLKPEIKKLEADEDRELVEAANINVEGARISGQILLDRINEIKGDLEKEKAARKEDAEYCKRRIKELERESRDYRSWAAKLVKQVVEAGKIPVPFVPSFTDSDIILSGREEEEKRSDK